MKTSVVSSAAAMPIGKPTASATSDRRASAPWRLTSATQRPASGPNSGPTTIAPTIRIGWSSTMPTAAICIAMTMKSRKLSESSVFSEVRDSTSSHTTASDGSPGAAFSAAIAASESEKSRSSTAIEPRSGMSSSLRSPMITLASSRATSQRITSPSGLPRGVRQVHDVDDGGRRRRGDRAPAARGPAARRCAGGPSAFERVRLRALAARPAGCRASHGLGIDEDVAQLAFDQRRAVRRALDRERGGRWRSCRAA